MGHRHIFSIYKLFYDAIGANRAKAAEGKEGAGGNKEEKAPAEKKAE